MILYIDIGRCPYAPNEPGYDAWFKADDERLARLNKAMRIQVVSLTKTGFIIRYSLFEEHDPELITYVARQYEDVSVSKVEIQKYTDKGERF